MWEVGTGLEAITRTHYFRVLQIFFPANTKLVMKVLLAISEFLLYCTVVPEMPLTDS